MRLTPPPEIVSNSAPGQAVYEPFCGSGTSIISAESIGRVCFAVELNPAYVDVTVLRWQAFTGKAAVLDGDGRRFGEIAAERRGDVDPVPDAPESRTTTVEAA